MFVTFGILNVLHTLNGFFYGGAVNQKEYQEYLKSSLWENIREKVFYRDHFMCQGCLESRATQVHHLSYDNIGFEFCFQLISVCDACHERIHRDKK